MRLGQRLADFPRPYVRGRGAWLAVRAMIVGSAAFAILEALSVQANTYFVQHIEPTWDTIGILCCVGWPVFIMGIGLSLATVPAIVLGKVLEALVVGRRLVRWASALAGAVMGAIGGMLICAPILWLQFDFVNQSGHGSMPVFELRAVFAIVIATLCGGWTGMMLADGTGDVHPG